MQRIINQFSYQPKPFLLYREPLYDTIVAANLIIDSNISFIQYSVNQYVYKNKYLLSIYDDSFYQGYKIICCTCVHYNKWLFCDHNIALAIFLKIKIKGFELKVTLESNTKKVEHQKLKIILKKSPVNLLNCFKITNTSIDGKAL